MSPSASAIADRAEELADAFVGFSLALPALLHPQLPLLAVNQELFGMPPDAPIEVYRSDGTMHSSRTMRQALQRVSELQGGGLREDLLAFVAMHGATRLGDDLQQAGLLRGDTSPLLEFARHLRNACAHGNRWHFRCGEPSRPAALRDRALERELHSTKAIYGWLAPGTTWTFSMISPPSCGRSSRAKNADTRHDRALPGPGVSFSSWLATSTDAIL